MSKKKTFCYKVIIEDYNESAILFIYGYNMKDAREKAYNVYAKDIKDKPFTLIRDKD
jgi:hypothetical protein